MTNILKTAWVIFRNVIIIFILLELILSAIYNYKLKSEYDDFISLKIESKVHEDMTPEEVKTLYYEYIDLEMQWTPYLHYSPKAYNGVYNTINNLGQRKTTQYLASDTAKTIKIFCFGGSTMYCVGARDETTIPSILSDILAQNYPKINFDITNFGTVGYNRDQEAIQLQNEILKNNVPDIALFFDGVNEVYAGYQNNDVRRPTNTSNRALEFNTKKSYMKRLALFFESSYTKKLIVYLRKKISTPPKQADFSPLAKKIAANYRNQILYAEAISKKYNINTINILQPTVFTKKTLSQFEKVMKKNENYLSDMYLKTYAAIKNDSLMSRDNSYLDWTNIFDSTHETVYTDFCHTVERGNRIIAKEMFEQIKPLLLKNIIADSSRIENK